MPSVADVKKDFPELADRSDDEVVDAVHKAFYSDLPRDDVARALGVKPTPPPTEKSGVLRRMGDYGLSAVQGAIQVPQAAVGLADLVTGGRVGKALENDGGDVGFRPDQAMSYLESLKSPEQQAANKAVADASQGQPGDDQGLMARTGRVGMAALQNPSVIAHSVVQSLPSMGAGGVIGRGALALAPRLGAIASGIGEGVTTMGQQAEQIRTDDQNPDRLLTPTQAALGAGSGAVTGLIGAFSGRLAQRLGFETPENLLTGIKGDVTKQRGIVKQVLGGAVTEGFLEELPQSVQEQVAQNLATGHPLDYQVDQQAVLGALSGAAMGAGAQAFHGHAPHGTALDSEVSPPLKTAGDVIREDLQPGGGPLATAVNAGIETAARDADAVAPPPELEKPQSPRAANADLIATIRKLPPEQQDTALGLHTLGNRMDVAPGVRRYAQNQLDKLLGPFQEETAGAPLAATEPDGKKAAAPVPAIAEVTPPKTGDSRDVALADLEMRAREAEAQRQRDRPAPATEEYQPGDILATHGSPFQTMRAAMRAQAANPGSEMVNVKGGIVIRPQKEAAAETKPAAAETKAPAAETEAAAAETTSAEPAPTLTRAEVDAAAHEAASSPKNDLAEPTDGQKEAGNYKKGHFNLQGLDISVENPQGSERRGKRPDGTEWSHTMSHHYGYIKRTTGADGEHVDAYIGPQPEATHAYVIDQLHQGTGAFDEHKAMLGFANQAAAIAAYSKNFDKGWKVGPVTAMPMAEFKTWVQSPDALKPLAPVAEKAAPASTGEVVTHTTGKGKDIRGVWRADFSEAQAKAIDPFSFNAKGKGWFIREKHVGNLPPMGTPAKSIGGVAVEPPKETALVRRDRLKSERAPLESSPQAGETATREAHNLEKPGATPGPATDTTPARVAPGPASEPAPVVEAAKPSGNTIFTDEAADKAREILRAKLGINAGKKGQAGGLDPDVLAAGVTLAGYHIEKGARTFAAYAKAMVADLGDAIKPYLKSFYLAAKFDPRATALEGMSSAAEVESAEVDALLEDAEPADSGPVATEPKTDTAAKEKTDDSTPAGPPPALDQPVASGQQSVATGQPARGAQPASEGNRRGDDAGVRRKRQRNAARSDAQAELGYARGDAAVPDGAADALAGDHGAVPARDFRPEPGGLKREGSWHATAARNLDIIDLARKIESEGRPATPEEQAQLSKYVGFGAGEIRNPLFPVPSAYQQREHPDRLVWPELVRDARWKPLAERIAALPADWQKSLLQSTQYAHYTSEGIIRSAWSAMQRLGFTGGKILEPGMGIGSFAMLMPPAVRATSKYTGIEFDGPTALIARLLSPQQNMLHEDFIKRKLPRDYFDVAIGNPPFSQTRVLADPDYEKQGFMLHDYFFAKSIDRVRPGGLLAFVTSKGTMDKQSDKARSYLAARADLLGAIRLPQTAFEDNAGTKVTTDVIFLRKRKAGEAPAGQAWGGTATVDTKDGPAVVNEYFAAHPEMVLGQQRLSGNMDDQGRRISGLRNADEYTVVSYDTSPEQLDEKFAEAVARLPQNAYSSLSQDEATVRRETAKVDFDPRVKREGVIYVDDAGAVMRVENGVGRELTAAVKLSDKDKTWLSSYVGVRDAVNIARLAQVNDADWQTALDKLNQAYDAHVAKHGPITAYRTIVRKSLDEEGNEVDTEIRISINRRLYKEDYDAALLTSLEKITESGDIVKSPFLKGRTIGKPVVREVRTVGDALAVSLDENGKLDLTDIAKRAGVSRDEAIAALGTQVYQTPQGPWQLSDEYLSGDVRTKLEEAEQAARDNPALRRNVDALKAVQPEPLGPSQISVKLGTSWVNDGYITEFGKEIGAGKATFDPMTESWQVEGGNERSGRRAGLEYGTAARSPSELLEAALNSRSVTVKGKADGKEFTDTQATTAAQEMVKKIRDKFKSWVWTDSERAADLVDTYNKRFNNIAPRSFDGGYLTLPGVSLRYQLHPHQLRAIARQIQTGDVYLAHAVGAGKTIEMIAGGMEQKRLGLIKKPIYAVPNHMLEQFANEFMELYPLANIMVADDENFHTDRRRAFIAAATLNAPDAIVITHSGFERIGVKEDSVAPIREEILDELREALEDTPKGERVRRSQLQQQLEAVEQRFDRIVGSGSKDSTIKFEDIGADYLYVDEAHAFRKLDFTTNQKLKGIDPTGSKRALDMYVKTQYLERQRPGRAFTFASGTAVTNTMGELYTIQRFFQGDELRRNGTATFDAWARQYGEAVAALEANAAGRYETVERFAKFDNVPELMSRIRSFMDVLNSEHLGALVKRPDLEGGRPNLVTVEPTAALKQYMKQVLVPRLERSRKWKPSKLEPFNPDPVIAITSDGRFAALDPRFFGANIDEDATPTKLTVMADSIAATYKATAGNEYTAIDGSPDPRKGSTQIVFYNLGFGAQSTRNRGFDARATLARRLVKQGVPRDQVLFFDDADTDAKKEGMFKRMRSGEARVLVGSAKKMGTGVNVQNRLKQLHYFDPPWFPADVEQPHGRIIRQGNQNAQVGINWYATKGTYDSTMWQMVGRKQRFIDQAFSGDRSLRSMDDMSEASAYEQAAAVASGDPRALQLAGLRQDVERFERLQAAHANEQNNVRGALRSAEWGVQSAEARIKTFTEAFKAIGERYFQFETGAIGGRTFTKQGEFGDALKAAFNAAAGKALVNPKAKIQEVGSIGPVSLSVQAQFDREDKPNGMFDLTATIGGHDFEIINGSGLGSDVDAVGLTRRVVNAANSIDTSLREAQRKLESEKADVTRLRKKQGAPFEHAQDLVEKYGELKTLEAELKAEGEAEAARAAVAPAPAVSEDGTVEGESPDGEEPAFARPGDTIFPGTPGDMPQERVLAQHQREVASFAARISTKWAGSPAVIVLRSMADEAVPAEVKALDREQIGAGAQQRAGGFFANGKVYLLSDNLPNLEVAGRTLMHEVLGHYGLRGAYGRDLGTILDRIATLNAGKVRAAAKLHGLDFDKVSQRRQAAEEYLAVLAETNPQLGWVRRAIAAIRTWLRENLPGYKSMKLSDDEIIRSFLAPARTFVSHTSAPMMGPPTLSPAFQRANEPQTPAFSRSLTGVLNDVGDARLPAGYIVSDLFNSAGKVSWWHKSVGTMFNLAQRSPAFKRVYDSTQRFLNDTSRYAGEQADLAPRILPKLDKWRDIGKSPLSAEDTKAIAAPIFEGTLSWVRDETGKPVRVSERQTAADALSTDEKARVLFKAGKVSEAELKRWQATPLDIYDGAVNNRYEREYLRGGVVWTADELRSMFNATPKQIELYDEFRRTVDRSIGDLATSEALRMGSKDVPPALRAEILAGPRDHDAAAMRLRDHLWDQAGANPERAQILNDAADKIVQIATHATDLQKRGYAPLSRFGQFSLDVVTPEGERAYFGLFETTRERARMARQMQANYPGAKITQGTVSQEAYRVFAGVSPETIELFGELLGLDSTGDDAKDKAFQQAIKLTQSTRSSMRRLIHRKGIAGFSEDAGRVLAGFVVSNARRTSSNLHMGELDSAVTDIDKLDGQLTDAAVQLREYVKNPQEEAHGIRGLLFTQYLGGSVASALVNSTQPFTVTFPWLSQFGGIAAAAKQMRTATVDAVKFAKTRTTGDTALDKALLASPNVHPQEIHQLMGQAMGRGHLVSGDGTRAGDAAAKARNAFSKITLAWGKVFSVAEQFNRRTTFIAAYRTALEQKMDDPVAFAERAIAETQFTYNKGNKPKWARGALGATLFTFKQYSVNYLEMLNRLWHSGPEGKKAALLAVAVLFLIGGSDGLPFADDADDVIDGFMQHLGYNFSTKRAKREFFAGILGDDFGRFMNKGLSGLPGVPIDVSGRMGMGNLIPATGLFTKKADHTSDVAELLGPVGDLGKRAGQAVGLALNGDVPGAINILQAQAARNIVKGIDMLKTGEYRDQKGRKVIDTSTVEAVFKMLGFQPNSVARVQEAAGEVMQMVGLTKLVQSELSDKLAKAMYEQDPEAMADARAMRDQWNEKNTDMRLKIDMPAVLKRLKEMRSSKADRIAKTSPAAIRQRVRTELTAAGS